MGTPRALTPVDQMRNVQRAASCGAGIAHDRAHGEKNRSNGAKPGAVTLRVAAQVAFNSNPPASFARGREIGAVFFEVAQHVLLAQQPGRQLFWRGASETMQVRADMRSGAAATSPMNKAKEIAILPSIKE